MNRTFTRLACLGIMSILLANASTDALAQNKQGYWELKDVLNQIYQSNPSLDAAREQYNETLELYPQARSGWLPSVNAEGSIYATDVDNSNFGSADGATTKEASLNVNQPIWRGGRTTAEIDRAQALIGAEKFALAQTEQLIFLQATNAYLNVIRDRALMDLYEQNEDILLNELRSTWERMEIGDITNTDVQQAKARLSRAKSDRIAAQNNLDLSHAEFEEIAGIKAPDKLMLPYLDFDFPENLNDMLSMAEEQNPEISSAQLVHKASEHNVDATSRELLPQVSGFASVNRQYDPQPGIIDRSESKTIGVRATLALYEGGKTRSRIREARSTAKRREFQIFEIKRQIRQEITSNLHSYNAAKMETENRKEEIDALEDALKGVREEAKLGQRSVLDVLDADQETIDAKALLVQANHNEIFSQFTLAQSLGLLRAEKLGLTPRASSN